MRYWIIAAYVLFASICHAGWDYVEASEVNLASNTVEAVVVNGFNSLKSENIDGFYEFCTSECVSSMKANNNYALNRSLSKIQDADLERVFSIAVKKVEDDSGVYTVAIKLHRISKDKVQNMKIEVIGIDGGFKISKML